MKIMKLLWLGLLIIYTPATWASENVFAPFVVADAQSSTPDNRAQLRCHRQPIPNYCNQPNQHDSNVLALSWQAGF